MELVRRLFWFVCLIIFSARVQAQTVPLQNLTEDDFKKIASDMSANFLHTSVSGAGTLGSIWGFEIGVVGGQTSTPNLNEVAQRSDTTGSADASKLYHGQLLGVLTVPAGFTVEAGFLPKVGKDSFKFDTMSLAVKWTVNEIALPDLPVSLAAKLGVTKSNLSFTQTVPPATSPTDFKFSDTEYMFAAFVSKDLGIFEPFAAFGMVSATADLSASGATTVFSTTYTTDQSASVKRSGTLFTVGTEVKLLAVKLGAEYSSLFGTSRMSGKLSMYF